MFRNLINRHDVIDLGRRAPRLGRKLVLRLFRGGNAVVAQTWAGEEVPTNWWNVPQITRRWNRLISGDEAVDYWQYFAPRYLTGRAGLHGLSIGCGSGERELRWAGTGAFSRIDGVDVSPERISRAKAAAKAAGLDGILRFSVGDVRSMTIAPASLDVLFGEGSLHHLTPLEPLLLRVREWLKPEGLLFVYEYVGPTRFQWTMRQLEAMNGLLRLLPQRLRREWNSSRIKRVVPRPSRLRMIIGDPSEAVESERLLPLLRRHFHALELREVGGGILHMLLHGIAHNFADDRAGRWLELCCAIEDELMAEGDVPSDHVAGVFRKS